MWNVQGLRKKISEIDAYINKFDIICLLETWIEEKRQKATEKKLPKEYEWLWTPAIREKKLGRPSGGIVIGIRRNINFRNKEGNSKGCWSSVEIESNQKWLTLFVIYNNVSLDTYRKELEKILDKSGSIRIFMGDLNARIGTLGPLIEGEERQTKDRKVNIEGKKWMNFFDTYKIKLLNGNKNGDYGGEFTRPGYSNQEEAVLDYAGASEEMLNEITLFKIGSQHQSDHFPLELTLAAKSSIEEREYEVQVWNNTTKRKYTEMMAARRPPSNVDELISNMKRCSTKIKKKSGPAKDKPWWTTECYIKRKELSTELYWLRAGLGDLSIYREMKREYKKCCKRAKKEFNNKCRRELDKVRSVAEGWKFIKKYKRGAHSTPTDRPPKEQLLTHFRDLLQGNEEALRNETETRPEQRIVLTKEEFEKTISALKENKAAGPDGLKAEALKYADWTSKDVLRQEIEEILNGKPVPEEWCEATILPIYKKGDPHIPSNFRGIAIGSPIYKLLAQQVNERLQEFVEQNQILPDTQNGFRKDRSTVDNIYITTQCAQKALSKPEGKLYALFIDFKTAFDSVNRNVLFGILKRQNIPEYIQTTIQNMYATTTYLVDGEGFPSYKGLKQGCPLSPLLFALYIAGIDSSFRANQLGGVVMGGKKIFCLGFADDYVVLAETPGDLRDMIRTTQRFAERRDLTINSEKTKVLVFSKGARRSREVWKLNGVELEEVDSFNYLGVTLQRNGQFDRHIDATADKANRRASEVWSIGERLFPHNIPLRLQMFSALVEPVMLYAAEVTGYSDHEELDIIFRRYIRWLLGLPQSTPKPVLMREVDATSIQTKAIGRAAQYESRIMSKPSEILRETHREALSGRWRHKWAERKEQVMAPLGWSLQVANDMWGRRPFFGAEVGQRAVDIERQESRRKAKYYSWYVPCEEEELPQYLRNSNVMLRMIARYRCGAEPLGLHSWRSDRKCRTCGKADETVEHLMKCVADEKSRTWKELLNADGRGGGYFKKVQNCRTVFKKALNRA